MPNKKDTFDNEEVQQNKQHEPVDLDVMLNEPVPFAKFGGETYSVKALTIAECRKYGKSLLLGPPAYVVTLNDSVKAFKECFDTHVFDSQGNPVKYEDIEDKWPDEAVTLFVKVILKLSD